MVPATAAVIFGAVCAAIPAWWITHDDEPRYTSSVVFSVSKRSPDTRFVSHSKTIIAEQTARQLERGPGVRAALTAANEINTDKTDASWVVGPGYGEVSLQVRSTDADAARVGTAAILTTARADLAALFSPDKRPASMKVLHRTSVSDETTSAWAVIAGAGIVGATTGFALFVAAGPRIPANRAVSTSATGTDMSASEERKPTEG